MAPSADENAWLRHLGGRGSGRRGTSAFTQGAADGLHLHEGDPEADDPEDEDGQDRDDEHELDRRRASLSTEALPHEKVCDGNAVS